MRVAQHPIALNFMLHVDMKVVDNEGGEVVRGQEGELLLKGDHMLAGYRKKTEETIKSLTDGRQWLRGKYKSSS